MTAELDYIMQRFNIKGVSMHTHPTEIAGFGRDDLAVVFGELGYKVGVEIGTWRGEYAEILCRANPGLLLHCVDPWQASSYGPKVVGWPREQERFEDYMQEAIGRLKPYNARILRKYSMDAVKKFKDESLDFVYLDGNHNFKHVAMDLCEWAPKVRAGGIVAGHDYARFKRRVDCHVKAVLNAYADSFGIRPWFVLGLMDKSADPDRDEYRTWFWVKE